MKRTCRIKESFHWLLFFCKNTKLLRECQRYAEKDEHKKKKWTNERRRKAELNVITSYWLQDTAHQAVTNDVSFWKHHGKHHGHGKGTGSDAEHEKLNEIFSWGIEFFAKVMGAGGHDVSMTFQSAKRHGASACLSKR